MAKEFKTFEELVELMERRGIKTDDATIPALKRESYYAIVNGYKDMFLDRDAMRSAADDVYIEGTTFRQIYDLFLFDRGFRQALFPYLTLAETTMKNAVVYAFCERNRDPDAYLDESNYCSAEDMLVPKKYRGDLFRDHSTNMENLIKILKRKLTDKKRMRPFVRHYISTYGVVPLWVLENDLTFGNVAHFYQLQKRGVQNRACRLISEVTGTGVRLTPHDLLRAFDVLVGFRNICAHDERLYCAEVKGARPSEMFSMLARVLSRDDLLKISLSLNVLTSAFSTKIDESVLIRAITTMGIEAKQK